MEGQMEGKKVVVLATHFVCGQPFSLVSGRLCSWVVVLDGGRWSFLMAGGGLYAWAGGRVLGARHSRLGVDVVRVVICGRGCCPWGWVVVYGRRVVVRGW